MGFHPVAPKEQRPKVWAAFDIVGGRWERYHWHIESPRKNDGPPALLRDTIFGGQSLLPAATLHKDLDGLIIRP